MLPGDALLGGMPVAHPVSGHPHLDVPILLLAALGFALVLAIGLALPPARAGGPRPWPQASWDGRLTMPYRLVRALVLAVVLLCVVAARVGSRNELENLAPALVVGAGWPLLFLGALLVPGLWRWLDPWDTASRMLSPSDRPDDIPRDDVRPAVVVALPLLWYLAVHRTPLDPRDLGLAMAAYLTFTLAGCLATGRRRWLSSAEPVGIVLTWVGRARPRRHADRRTPTGLAALLGLVAAGTLFGALRRTEWWSELVDPTDQTTTSLAWFVASVVGAALVTAIGRVARLAEPARGRATADSTVVALSFAPAVAGVVVAVGLARNRLTNAVQLLPGLLGDPFGRGWDLLGQPAATPLGPVALLTVQLAVVVAAHLLGAVTAARLLPRGSRLPALVLLAQSAAASVAVLSAH